MKLVRGLATLGASCLAQVLLSRYFPGLSRYCDLFTILVVYYGLTRPQAAAMMMGAGAGLVEDSLVGAILGLNGFKKTLTGYLVGSFGSLFMLNQAIPRFGILFAATLIDPLVELGLTAAMGQSVIVPGMLGLLQRGLGNGVIGLLVFWIAARLP
ncbi:MAG TPA: rod shape-determining protein MreD [Candidatus Polarisedimenticolia bacterium]|nr:rod shape-determining protein MreD [Candidatus Polarisedimenticolia bacterium]